MTKIIAAYRKLPNWAKAGFNSGWQSASGTFLLTLLGWLAQVQEWAGQTHGDFPAVSPLGKAVAALVVGIVVGLLTALFRKVKPGPNYPTPPPAE